MRDVPEIDEIPGLDDEPEADFAWVSPCQDYGATAWFTVTPDGVELCVQTMTCMLSRTVTTQPLPPEAFSALVRAAQRAETEALVQQHSTMGARQ